MDPRTRTKSVRELTQKILDLQLKKDQKSTKIESLLGNAPRPSFGGKQEINAVKSPTSTDSDRERRYDRNTHTYVNLDDKRGIISGQNDIIDAGPPLPSRSPKNISHYEEIATPTNHNSTHVPLKQQKSLSSSKPANSLSTPESSDDERDQGEVLVLQRNSLTSNKRDTVTIRAKPPRPPPREVGSYVSIGSQLVDYDKVLSKSYDDITKVPKKIVQSTYDEVLPAINHKILNGKPSKAPKPKEIETGKAQNKAWTNLISDEGAKKESFNQGNVKKSPTCGEIENSRGCSVEDISKHQSMMSQVGRELKQRRRSKVESGIGTFKFGMGTMTFKRERSQNRDSDEKSTISNPISELIYTEYTYMNKLGHVIENYLQYFRKMNVSHAIEQVFSNVEELYIATYSIYGDLEGCQTPDEIAKVFLDHAKMFDYYTEFLRNKSLSYQQATNTFANLIKDRQKQLGDPHPLESYLLDPVQRPGRYKLLLEKIQKDLTKANNPSQLLAKAIDLVGSKITYANTLLAVDSILWCPIDLTEKGTFLMKEKFNIKHERKTVVFLFQRCVVLCEDDPVNFDRYKYVNSIEMENLSLRHCEWSKGFELSCFDRSKSQSFNRQFQFYLEASIKSVKEDWIDQIQRILWDQLQYCKDELANQVLERSRSLRLGEGVYDILDPSTFRENIIQYDDEEYYSLANYPFDKESRISGPFFDKDFCLRLEIITNDVQTSQQIRLQKAPEAQTNVIKEFIVSEEEHLKQMQRCISDFYTHPEDMSSYKYLLHENIESIYNETEKLYLKLFNCKSIDDVAKAFTQSEELFNFYTVYAKNKSGYDFIARELEKHTQVKSPLSLSEFKKNWNDCVIKLIIKPSKYKSFLKELATSGKSETVCRPLLEAVRFLDEKSSQMITVMNIDSIQKSPIDLLEKGGAFLKKTDCTITETRCKCVLFLFEKMVVFCVVDEHRDSYLYFDSMERGTLAVSNARYPNDMQFECVRVSGGGKEIRYQYHVSFSSPGVKTEWMDKIKMLQT